MKKILVYISIAIFCNLSSYAQNLFTKEMGPSMNIDNSLGTILMDLSTENKEYLMAGEQAKTDTSYHYYPNRLFGANTVYIAATYDNESYNANTYDKTTKGQIVAIFTPTGADLMPELKNLTTNIEASAVWKKFFAPDTKNRDLNKIMYVQKVPFTLPPNAKLTPAQSTEINKGLKQNFDTYEIKFCIETKAVEYYGNVTEYIQIRSWVQIKDNVILAKKAADTKQYQDRLLLEKKEMKNIKDIEAGVVKPNTPGLDKDKDEEAVAFFRKRHLVLIENYETILANYKAYSAADKIKNKQKDLKAAKEAYMAVYTNYNQWDKYLEKAIFNKTEYYDGETTLKGMHATMSFTNPIFKQLVDTFDLK